MADTLPITFKQDCNLVKKTDIIQEFNDLVQDNPAARYEYLKCYAVGLDEATRAKAVAVALSKTK